jgi:phage antirepressor YoqD-like protein
MIETEDIMMNFTQFLLQKHLLIKGERKIKEISAKQYNNRLENMLQDQIYNGEKQINIELVNKIQAKYSDWTTYRKTIDYYIKYCSYINRN